jgi:hypothetical protein
MKVLNNWLINTFFGKVNIMVKNLTKAKSSNKSIINRKEEIKEEIADKVFLLLLLFVLTIFFDTRCVCGTFF